jgi:predicted lipid-binding transport protein (Tim44 family)
LAREPSAVPQIVRICGLSAGPCGAVTAAESKRDVFDIYTIIFLALAVFIFLRLRSVLGQRTGRERPPYDPYSARDTIRGSTNDNVVALPGRGGESPQTSAAPAAAEERWKGIAEPGTALAAGLDAIEQTSPGFDAKHFITGARQAYEMIVTAYAEGDRRGLRNLLSRDVYEGFETAIREREQRGETSETRFVSIDKSDITAAELRGQTAQVTVRFVSKLVSVTRDRSGDVIDGSPEKVTDVTDVWTFARDVSSRDPNWKLVATEAGQ